MLQYRRIIAAALAAPLIIFAAAACDDDSAPPAPTPEASAPAGGVPSIREADGLSTVEIAEKLAPSIVRIQTEGATLDVFGRLQPGGGVGSGAIIDADGHIVTNNHVITIGEGGRLADRITVTLADQRTLRATVVGRDEATDLAVLRIDAGDLTPATFGDPAELQVGQDVVAIGFALGITGQPSVTRGVISATDRTISEPPYTIPDAIQTDAGINPGNSGGPLVNARGEIVGINTAIIRNAQSIGFSISARLVKPTVEELIAKGRIERAYLGVGTVDVTPAVARNFDLPVDTGIAVTLVAQGSPAAGAGFRVNDIITAIDGEEIANNGEFLAALAARSAGDSVEITFIRGGERNTIEVTLTVRPAA